MSSDWLSQIVDNCSLLCHDLFMPDSSEAQPLVLSSVTKAFRRPDAPRCVAIVLPGHEETPALHRLARRYIRENYRASRSGRGKGLVYDSEGNARVAYGLNAQAARQMAVGQMALAGWSVNPL